MYRIQQVEFDGTYGEDFVYDLPRGQDAWLLILTHTSAVFLINGVYEEYPPSCIALYKPGQQVYYRACRDACASDWVCFLSDDGRPTDSQIPCGTPLATFKPRYYHQLFGLLSVEHGNGGALKEIIVDKLMQVMLDKLGETYGVKQNPQMHQQIYWLKSEIYRHPGEPWTVTLMGDMLSVSTGHLEVIYKSIFGVTCMEDVILSRIKLAKKYLQSDNFSIAEILPLYGYRSAEHFYRQW